MADDAMAAGYGEPAAARSGVRRPRRVAGLMPAAPAALRAPHRRRRQRTPRDGTARHQLPLHHRQLNAAGIDVVFKSVAGDDRAVPRKRAAFALASADLVVVSGGLGPTDDDVTREVVAEVLGRPLPETPRWWTTCSPGYALRGFTAPMPRNNLRQAMVPEGGEVLENPHGSAPGLSIDHDGRVVVLLPGPPRELRPMMTALSARLAARSTGHVIVRRSSTSPAKSIPGGPDAAAALPRVGRLVATGGRTILAKLGQIDLLLSVRHASAAEAAACSSARRPRWWACSATSSSAPTAAGSRRSWANGCARVGLGGGGGVLHRRAADVAAHRCARKLALRRHLGRCLRQRRQDGAAWRAAGPAGGARRGERTGRRRDGRGHSRPREVPISASGSPASPARPAARRRSPSAR